MRNLIKLFKSKRALQSLITKITKLKIRTNLLIIFGVYIFLAALTIYVYSYISLSNIANYKKQGKIDLIAYELKYIALTLQGMENAGYNAGHTVNKTDILKDGIIIIADQNGKVYFSSNPDYKGINLANTGTVLQGNMTGVSGYFIDSGIFGEDKYIFYNRSAGNNIILLYAVPIEFIEEIDFHTFKYILYSALVYLSTNILLIFIFKRNIYKPIVNIETIYSGLAGGETEMELAHLTKNNPLYPLYRDLISTRERLKNLVSREYNAIMMKKQAELDALQSQINPHFLYNTLDSIRGQAMCEGVEDIERMTKVLSDMFRYSISDKSNLVTLEKELLNAENYILIQQYRFNNKFCFINKVDKDTLNLKVPKLLVQPIVENAVYHGLEVKLGKGSITIASYRTEKRLVINIQDDGVGIDYDRLVKINDSLVRGQTTLEVKDSGLRMGLMNVNARIKMNFGPDYGLRVYSQKGVGTNVEVVLPVIE
jgi:sensor histidine kinase YesM